MKPNIMLNLLKWQLADFWLPILILGIFILGAFLRFYGIDKRCLYTDEMLNIEVISQATPHDVLEKVRDEYRPDLPLYYLLLYNWSAFSKSPFWLRALSALSGLLLLFIAYRFTKYLFDIKTAILVFYLTAISPLLVLYNQTFRYYALNALFNLLSLYLFIKAVRNNRIFGWIFYIAARTASLYIDYSSFFFIFFEAIFVTLYRKKYPLSFKKYFLCLITIFILWIPMVPYLFRGFNSLLSGEGFSRIPIKFGWISNFFYFFFSFSLGKTISPFNYSVVGVAALVYIFILINFFRSLLLKRIPQIEAIFIILVIFTATILCAISKYNSDRYILAAVVPYFIVVSLGILKSPKKVRLILIIIVSILSFYSLFNLYNKRQYHNMELIDDWDKVAVYVDSHTAPDDIIINDGIVLNYYLNRISSNKKIYKYPESKEDANMFIAKVLEYKKQNKVILLDLALSGDILKNTIPDEFTVLTAWLKKNNLKLVNIKRFNRDIDGDKKRRYINRLFPEYRITVYVYSRE